MFDPSTQVYICDVPLTNSYEHTFHFDSLQAQTSYFDSKVIKRFDDYTFVRKTGSVKVAATMETARAWSYLFVSEGWQRRYYFIVNHEYINDATTELFLELDVMQTYLFNTSLMPCFVEREHAASDLIGEHTVEESLEIGELVDSNTANFNMGGLSVVIASTLDLAQTTEELSVPGRTGFIDNQYSGLKYYTAGPLPTLGFSDFLNDLTNWGKSDCIVSMWMYPTLLLTLSSDVSDLENARGIRKVIGTASGLDQELYYPSTLGRAEDPYTPRNKKLLTYPYCHLYVTNNSGSTAAYRFERFSDPQDMRLRVAGSLSPEGACRLYPMSYDGTILNYKMGLDLGGFPTCAWAQDVYKLWLAQTQNTRHVADKSARVTIAGGMFTAVAGGIGSALTGNVAGAVGSVAGGVGAIVHGGLQIESLLAQQADKSIEPPQLKGSSSASVAVNANFCTFSVVIRTVDRQHAKILDDYFDMYGYKTLQVKVPNKNHRAVWWYTKTIGCIVKGSACVEDKTKIANIYNKGVTFWRVPDSLGDYSLDNTSI